MVLLGSGQKSGDGTIRSNVATNNQTIGIGQVAEGYAYIYPQNGSIVVETNEGQPLQVYDVTGRRLYDTVSTGKDLFEVPATGVYLVRVGTMKTRRVVVKR